MPAAETKTPQALSIQKLAKQLNVSVRTAHRLIASGDLRAHQIGRQWRVLETDLQDYLARHVNHDAAGRGNRQPTAPKPAGLGAQIEETVAGSETEASIEPQQARSPGREPLTVEQLGAALAKQVMGWAVSPERFLLGNRQWIIRSNFQPFKRIQDSFRLLEKAAATYSITRAPNGVLTATVRIGALMGKASGRAEAATISFAIARAIGMGAKDGL